MTPLSPGYDQARANFRADRPLFGSMSRPSSVTVRVRCGSKCEELKVRKSSPAYPTEQTSMRGAATSPTGQQETHALQQEASLFDHLRVAIKNRASHAPSIAVGKT